MESALKEFMVRVEQAVDEFEASLSHRTMAPHVLVIGHSYARAVRLFRAIAVLVRDGLHANEAHVLARSMLEEVFRLQQLAQSDDSGRMALSLGHLAEAAEHARRLGKRSREAKLPVEDDSWERQAAEVDERVRHFEHERGIHREFFTAPKRFASESGGLVGKRNLFEWELLHFFAHGSAVIRGFSESKTDDIAIIGSPNQSYQLGSIVSLMAVDYLLQATAACATCLDVVTPQFEPLETELSKFASKLDAPGR
jgi:hypothetical protein